jgi:histidinol-phosphate aminotransferase
VFASEANLVLVRFPHATQIWQGLADRGIVVRNFDGPPGPLAGCLRITVGTPAENALLLAALGEICG